MTENWLVNEARPLDASTIRQIERETPGTMEALERAPRPFQAAQACDLS
jgi:hypothetical protein